MDYALVLFDLDGTLVDTAPDIADAVNRVLRDRALPPMPEAWIRGRIGHGSRLLLAQSHAAATHIGAGAPHPALVAALLEEFAQHYAACCGQRGRVYPDAAPTLRALRRAGVKLALLTNKERRFARLVLEVHELDGEFDLEIYGDSLPAKKPDPLPVRHCLGVLSVPASQALLVGDSPVDVQAGHAAGIAVWAVSHGYGSRADLMHADLVIDGLTQLRTAYSPRASSSSLYLRSNPRNW